MKKEIAVVFLDTSKPNTPFNNRYSCIRKMTQEKYKVIYKKIRANENKVNFIRGFSSRLRILKSIVDISFKNRRKYKLAFYFGYIDPLTIVLMFVIAKFFNIKIICEVNEFPVRVYKYGRENIVSKFIETKFADGYSIISDQLVEYFESISLFKKRIIKLPMTVDENRFVGVVNINTNNIVYSGSLNHKKDGLNFLLEAFKILSQKSKLNLVIAGYGTSSEIDYLLEFIKNNNLENRVSYLGYIKSSEIPSLVCSAKILVMPRPKSKQAEGGFPSKLGEYLMSRKPIVVTRTGEISNFLNENEVFFIDTDNIIKGLIKKILYIENNYEYSLKKAEYAYMKVMRSFSLEANERKLNIFIREVVE